jgi:hypothetical protein
MNNTATNINIEDSINLTENIVPLKKLSAKEKAMSLFLDLRNFSSEEAVSYEKSLSKLFKKTGRK